MSHLRPQLTRAVFLGAILFCSVAWSQDILEPAKAEPDSMDAPAPSGDSIHSGDSIGFLMPDRSEPFASPGSIGDAIFESEPLDEDRLSILNASDLRKVSALQEVEVYPLDPGSSNTFSNPEFIESPQAAFAPFQTPSFGAAAPGQSFGRFRDTIDSVKVGLDLYSPPEFEGGLIVFGQNIAMKFGGYVKADFIYDFDPIDSTDSFITTEIPVGAPPRTNSRFHARQSRLSFDTRWMTNDQPVRVFVEGDFFSEGDRFRLRHAYGQSGSILVGQTWTTFTDIAAAPATLDFEGSVSNINRRQAQARYTRTICHENLKMALAVEDTKFIIEIPDGITGKSRSPSPDFVGRLRWELDRARFQIAGLYRNVGFQPTGASADIYGDKVLTANAWGWNFTGVMLFDEQTKGYYKILYGDGIGSYRDLPDAAPTAEEQVGLLPLFAWMVGITHDWRSNLSSNFTYAVNTLDTSPFQAQDGVRSTTYLAANLIWSPLDRVSVGGEYLYGVRENVDGQSGSANRLQMSIIFDLP